MARPRLLIPCLALFALSCAQSTTAPPSNGTGTDSRGTALTGEHAFDISTTLAWSQASNEVLGAAAFGGTTGGPGLIGVNAVSGGVRLLDAAPVLFPAVTHDGANVLYDAVVSNASAPANDSTLLRVRSLAGSAPATLTSCPGLCAFTFVLSADDRYLAWTGTASDPLEPDTVRVLDRVTGARRAFVTGEPLTFSPDDGTLMIRNPLGAGGYATVALASGTLTPFPLDLPAGATGATLRWATDGVHALYVLSGNQLRVLTPSGDALLFAAPESIEPTSLTWSPNGARVALWTVGPIDNGADTAWRLYAVNVGGASGALTALGRSVGHAITFSPDGSRLAYLYADRLFTTALTTP